MKRIGVDVGGTFTDLIYVDDEKGTVLVHKTPSTPADPSIATVDGITTLCEMAGIKPADLDQVFHGTTVATNIVIEHNGAEVGMITTEGYRDILHIARHKKPMNFSLWQNLPWQAYPIARRRHRLTVKERTNPDGTIETPLNEREVRAAVRKLKKANVDAIAVCLLFSFKNPKHEKMVAKIVKEEYPEGYRDILHIARHKKPMNFSLWQNLPWQAYPIARRRHRLTVKERTNPDGTIETPLNEREVRAAVRKLKKANVEAIAVCLLFSFKNPKHEKMVAKIVKEEYPEAYLSVSSEVIPQYREYERFSTVALNAFVGPKVSNYVRRFDQQLRKMGVKTGIHLMTSAAGVATPKAASEKPVNLLMSGPIAGVVGGIWAGRVAGEPNVITLDVGGTSADIGLAQDGKLRMKHLLDTKVGPYQAMIPMVDVDTIGAGGGSIAYVDSGGIFRVGPRSAGADPGPAAYGRGGTEPTATDAIVALGWLRPELFLGGRVELRPDLARKAIDTKIGKPLKLSTEEAALGIFKVLVHSMVDAIEQSSVRKGFDPREFALVAEGGGGPLFSSHIAPEVGVKHVLVPNYPGITAALGLLTTDMVYEFTSTSYAMASELSTDAKARKSLEAQFADLEKQALKQFAADGVGKNKVKIQRIVDARYEGQGYELRVDAGGGAINDRWIKDVKNAFHDIHEREFSRRFEDSDVQIANIRIRAIGQMPGLKPASIKKGTKTPPKDALKMTADAWFEKNGKPAKFKTKFYERTELLSGNVVAGPAIITQFDSTTVVPPGFTAEVDPHGNLIVRYSAAVAKAAQSGH